MKNICKLLNVMGLISSTAAVCWLSNHDITIVIIIVSGGTICTVEVLLGFLVIYFL